MSHLEPDGRGHAGDTEEVVDIYGYFDNLEEGPEPRGRPEDSPGVETRTILHTYGSFTAGKQYRPDPSGERRAIKARDYNIGSQFIRDYAVIGSLEGIRDLLQILSADRTAFLVRGRPVERAGRRMRRRGSGEIVELINRRMRERHDDGAFEDVPRQLQMLDLDGLSLPPGMSIIEDPNASVIWAVDNLLPPEFQDVSFVYQLSPSAGLTKFDNQLNVHLWFFTDQPLRNDELRAWATWWNAKQRNKIIDPAVFTAVQPHYTNDPVLLAGLVDPLAGRRLGLVHRQRRTVSLRTPTATELAEEGRLKRSRALKSISHRAAAESGSSSPIEPSSEALTSDRDDTVTVVGAVRVSPGWRGYLEFVGFEGHIRTQISAAIGSYFFENGSHADRQVLSAEIERTIRECDFLDCDEPWSRSRRDALDYVTAPPGGISNVDEMIRDFAKYQAESEKRAEEKYEPSWPLPQLSADEAFDEIDKAIFDIACSALMRRDIPTDPIEQMYLPPPSQTAILCEPGVGKTEAMIKSVGAFLSMEPSARVVIAVPTHHLGQGLAERFNEEFGKTVAAEWHGAHYSDPKRPGEKMCRLADTAAGLQAVGGDLSLLCSSRDGHCPHHPRVAGSECCGYLRQQLPTNRNGVRVWIIPSNMLAKAPPPALRRPGTAVACHFDLVVIDEAPWLGLISGFDRKPGIPVAWLAPDRWQDQKSRRGERESAFAIETLTKIHGVLSEHPLCEVTADTLLDAGISEAAVKRTRQFLWSCKVDLREFVRPGMSTRDLDRAVSEVGPINKRVEAVAGALEVMGALLRGQLAPSGFELVEREHDGRFLRLRWRNEINPAWLKSPVIYLDAAGTGGAKLALAWLPNIEVTVKEARAKSPHMRITQITDTPMAYSRIFPHEVLSDKLAEQLARVLETKGQRGLVVCPKKLQEAWEAAKRLPRWDLWHFNAIRGRDEAADTPQLIVISRPLPPPAEVELRAETIFGHRVQRLGAGEFYPRQPIGRLMADGTGRRALAFRHPDPDVEAVRFAACEGELIQAIGRGRGVRRKTETALDVLLLTNVPVPLPVNALTTWKAVSDDAGPIEVLAARGLVPLDYEGIASALPTWFSDGASANEWFRYRPEALNRLRRIRDAARYGGPIVASEFLGNSYKNTPIQNSQKLVAYRYSQGGGRQKNLLLVDAVMHPVARAAAAAVLGDVDLLEPVAPSADIQITDERGRSPTAAERIAHLARPDRRRRRHRRGFSSGSETGSSDQPARRF